MKGFLIGIAFIAALVGPRTFAGELKASALSPEPQSNWSFLDPRTWSDAPPNALQSIDNMVLTAQLGDRPVVTEFSARALSPVPAANWSGFYIGAGIDARFNAVDANVTSATVGTPATNIPLPPVTYGCSNWFFLWCQGPSAMQYLDHISIGLRLYGGWNHQLSARYVVGVEADFAYAHEQAVFHGSPYPVNLIFGSPSTPFGASFNDSFGAKTTWDASARVRAGWLATPSLLVYLTAGLAWAHLQVTSTCSTIPTSGVSNCAPGNYFGGTLGPAVITHSATNIGWTAGLGLDWWFGSHWVARAQYRFSDFGYPSFLGFKPFTFTDVRACTGCPASASPLTVTYELPVMQHNFEVGVAYKF